MSMLIFLILNVFILLAPECFSQDLPSYFPRCCLEDPDLNTCIAKAAKTLRPYISKGIKEIKFPSFNPLVVPNVKVQQESQLVNYTATLWNFTTKGLDGYDLTNVRYDPKTMTFDGSIEFDPLPINTGYIIQGSLLSIPIIGNGTAQAVFGPVNGTFEIKGAITKRKGIQYYNPIGTEVRFTIEDGSYYLAGLFDGNKNLERLTNNMLNQNSKMLAKAVTPALENLAEMGLMYLMKVLTQAVPYDKLFPCLHN